MKEKHFPEGLNDGIRIGVSESGYTNDRLSYRLSKHNRKAVTHGNIETVIELDLGAKGLLLSHDPNLSDEKDSTTCQCGGNWRHCD